MGSAGVPGRALPQHIGNLGMRRKRSADLLTRATVDIYEGVISKSPEAGVLWVPSCHAVGLIHSNRCKWRISNIALILLRAQLQRIFFRLWTAELPPLTISSLGRALVNYPQAKSFKTIVPC